MKKFFYLIGAFVTVAAIFATIAILLKKLRISLSIEGISDDEVEEENNDIGVSIESTEDSFDETADAVEEALEELLAEENNKEIEVEISEL